MHWSEALVGKTLLVTDKESDHYGHEGRMLYWESDKPDHILFESNHPIFYGEEYLTREQFTLIYIDDEINRIDREIEELLDKKKIYQSLKK